MRKDFDHRGYRDLDFAVDETRATRRADIHTQDDSLRIACGVGECDSDTELVGIGIERGVFVSLRNGPAVKITWLVIDAISVIPWANFGIACNLVRFLRGEKDQVESGIAVVVGNGAFAARPCFL